MDIVAWLWWAISSFLLLAWSIFWFLISGWVSTLLQIAVVVLAIFFFKYGWQRAPAELWLRLRSLGGYVWRWLRRREGGETVRTEVREVVKVVRVKEFGDLNFSTFLTLLMMAGLLLLPVS